MINAVKFYRVARWLYLHHIPFLPKLIMLLIFLIYNSKISYKCEIGENSFFGYGGIGVVLHEKTIIGKNSVVGQNVTIGGGGQDT
jgi:serine O-acetyltransferase